MFNRTSVLMGEDFGGIREALINYSTATGQNLLKPIRETPFRVFFSKDEDSLRETKINPNLPEIWKQTYGVRIGDYAKGRTQETMAIPTSIAALKVTDEVLEGAEPFSDWKQYSRLIEMTTPKVNVPKTKYTDTVGQDRGMAAYAEGGTGTAPPIGGKIETVELDTAGTNGSYRGTIAVHENDVKDNNFLAVEMGLKNAGNEFYYKVGVDLLDAQIAAVPTSNQATKASLDSGTPSNSELEAIIEVIRSKFPGTQRNRADTMFINPADAAKAVKNAGTSGEYAFINKFLLGPTDGSDVINNSGLAIALGLRNVFETPQIDAGQVLITKRDIAQVTGLREDLTIKSYDLSTGGLYESDLIMRYDKKAGHADTGSFLITSF